MEKAVAEQEMTSIVARLARAYPDTNRPATVRAEPLSSMFVGDEERSILGAMMASGLFVLLIACANVANLLLAILGSTFTDIGLSALFLAAVGLYGVIVNSVVAGTGVLLAVGLLPTLVPAIRATRVDPVEALREE